jgi:steroid 5-alpha reductase family enzyme
VTLAFAFTTVNSYLTTKYAIYYPFYDPITTGKIIRWAVGMFVFFIAMGGNIWADQTLLNLRNSDGANKGKMTAAYLKKLKKKKFLNQRTKRGNKPAKEKKYFIPKGVLYELISCPNYAFEILEWVGLLIAFPTKAMINFVLCTCFNLIPRAISTHKWYQQKFKEEYPANRKAIIPYLL